MRSLGKIAIAVVLLAPATPVAAQVRARRETTAAGVGVEAPGGPGARSAHTQRMQATSNAGPRDASAATPVAVVLRQALSVPPVGQLPVFVQPVAIPATKLEGFRPAADSVVTLGYEVIGTVGSGRISVDVREVRDSEGHSARGLAVVIRESQTRHERSYVDADEIPALLKGLDVLINAIVNPTQLKRYEVTYTTRGSLILQAYSNALGATEYSVQVGRTLPSTVSRLGAADLHALRAIFDEAQRKLLNLAQPLPGSGGA